MKSELKGPFKVYTDSHHIKKNVTASVGILFTDKKGIVIDRIFEIKELTFPSTLMAEATGFCKGISLIPKYCNEAISSEYENNKFVEVRSDYQDLIDLMNRKLGNGNVDFLRKRRNGNGNCKELDELEKMVEDILGINDSYEIKYKKIDGGGKNPAHYLCRIAEGRLA
jgi:hypothetical protein